jgi:hypothetical protein
MHEFSVYLVAELRHISLPSAEHLQGFKDSYAEAIRRDFSLNFCSVSLGKCYLLAAKPLRLVCLVAVFQRFPSCSDSYHTCLHKSRPNLSTSLRHWIRSAKPQGWSVLSQHQLDLPRTSFLRWPSISIVFENDFLTSVDCLPLRLLLRRCVGGIQKSSFVLRRPLYRFFLRISKLKADTSCPSQKRRDNRHCLQCPVR